MWWCVVCGWKRLVGVGSLMVKFFIWWCYVWWCFMFIVLVIGCGGFDESGAGRDFCKDGYVLLKVVVFY